MLASSVRLKIRFICDNEMDNQYFQIPLFGRIPVSLPAPPSAHCLQPPSPLVLNETRCSFKPRSALPYWSLVGSPLSSSKLFGGVPPFLVAFLFHFCLPREEGMKQKSSLFPSNVPKNNGVSFLSDACSSRSQRYGSTGRSTYCLAPHLFPICDNEGYHDRCLYNVSSWVDVASDCSAPSNTAADAREKARAFRFGLITGQVIEYGKGRRHRSSQRGRQRAQNRYGAPGI